MSGTKARGLGRRATRLSEPKPVSVPKRVPTTALLIDAAEQLFARHGFDGISLREIAATAGQANSNAIQYHFRDKAGLISAILDDRVAQIDVLRRELLQRLPSDAAPSPRELLKILWLPTMAIRGADGSHIFCRLLLQYRLQPTIASHPIDQFYDLDSQPKANAESEPPAFLQATQLLRAQYAALPQAILARRLSALSLMFLATVVEHDNAQLQDASGARSEFDAEPILAMALAALAAPA